MIPLLSHVMGLVLQVDPATISESAEMGGVENWDSMQQVVLMSMLEQTYGVSFSPEEINSSTSVGLIRQALARRGVTPAWTE